MRRRVSRVHFIGIGGIGMSALAELMLHEGYAVTGSDLAEGITVERLRSLGVPVTIGHDAANVDAPDLVVYSSAVRLTNPERQAAADLGIPVIPRGELLAELMRGKEGIAIAGTHGKTTTTSLVTAILSHAGRFPTAIIGGRVADDDAATTAERRGAIVGKSDLFVAEVDESDGSFLLPTPAIAVITSIDPEHLDHHGSFESLCDSFVAFGNGVPFWGLTVVCVDHPRVREILPRLRGRLTTYGLGAPADLTATATLSSGFGTSFEARLGGESLGEARIPLPGAHNVLNALAAIAVGLEHEVPFPVIADALEQFRGVERRFEHKGVAAGVTVVDDYGHHPAEIRATLGAARAAHSGRVVAVFQPHRYSRTRDCFEDFTAAFDDSDVLVVTEVYAAGEDPIDGADGRSLVDAILRRGHADARLIPTLDDVTADLPSTLRDGDLVITLGAGSVSSLGPRLLAALEGDRP